MILDTKNIKNTINKILLAIDTSEHTLLTDTLEIKASNKELFFTITNKEYYVQVHIPIDADEELHATVNANMFLKLISQITTDSIKLSVTDKSLIVVGNGKFKIPLILAFDKLLELPELTIEAITQSLSIPTETLRSICTFNAAELNNNAYNDIIRKSYYLDQEGCITFTDGACVNNFKLDKPLKVLLSSKIIKLFKLFSDDTVQLDFGFNQVGESEQVRLRFYDSSVKVVAITYSTNSLLAKFPVKAIRDQATKIYPNSTSINRIELLQAINRFVIFNNYDINTTECKFTFVDDNLIIENKIGGSECIKLATAVSSTPYIANIDILRLKNVLSTQKDQMLNINFGDHSAIVIVTGNVFTVLPECTDLEV